MFQQHSNRNRDVQNHFLVFVYNLKLSPMLLNDDGNSFEVFSINSTSEFVNCFQSQRPGCLVTDTNNDFFSFPNLNMMSRLLPIVMVTNTSSVRAAVDATHKGAHSVLRDFSNHDRVREAVRSACFADSRGEYSPYSMRLRIQKLTSKERQVIYMSIRGKTTKMISGELGVCHQTVDKHKKRALSKLKASSVVDLLNMLLDSQRLAQGITVAKAEVPQPHQPPANPPAPMPQKTSQFRSE